MIYVFLLTFYFGCCWAWYRRTGTLFHPTVVHSLSWLVSLGWHCAYSGEFTPVSGPLASLLVLASLAFFAPFLLLPRVSVALPRFRSRLPDRPWLTIGLVAVFMLPALSLYLAVVLTGSLSAFSLAALRDSFVGEETTPSIGIGIVFPLVLGALYYVRQVSTLTWLRRLAVTSAGLMAALSTSKVFFFILIAVAAVPTLLASSSRVLLKNAVVATVLGLAVFVVLHLALGKFIGASSAETPGEMLHAAFLTLAVYFGGSVSALDQELVLGHQIPDGYLYAGCSWLGRILASPVKWVTDERILPFVYIPEIGTNVFTAYAPWLHEFGPAGVLIFSGAVGVVYYVLHARSGTPGGRFLFAFSLFPLAFMFHNEFFLLSFNQWVGFLFVAWLLSRVLEPADHA